MTENPARERFVAMERSLTSHIMRECKEIQKEFGPISAEECVDFLIDWYKECRFYHDDLEEELIILHKQIDLAYSLKAFYRLPTLEKRGKCGMCIHFPEPGGEQCPLYFGHIRRLIYPTSDGKEFCDEYQEMGICGTCKHFPGIEEETCPKNTSVLNNISIDLHGKKYCDNYIERGRCGSCKHFPKPGGIPCRKNDGEHKTRMVHDNTVGEAFCGNYEGR